MPDAKIKGRDGKLVSIWKIEDFSHLDHMEKLNYTAYWKNKKIVSNDPEIIEGQKITVLQIPNFTRFLMMMKAAGYTLLLQRFDETIFAQNDGNAKNKENSNPPSISENANIGEPRIYAGETNFNIPFWDKLVTFYYTGPDKNIFITQGVEEISGTYEIKLRGEDILSIPKSVADIMVASNIGKILEGGM